MLEVRHFEIVEAIAGAGSVTGAARRLHLTQPAVSHALGNLEDRLGVALFRREAHGMELTREGEHVLSAGREVLRTVRDVERELELFREGCRGVVRVSTECYTCYHWLPSILERFGDAFPDVEVVIVPEATRAPLEALLAERLDLAIVHSPVEDAALAAEELFEDELVAVVPVEHPWAGKERVEAADFADEVLLLHADAEESLLVTQVLDPAGVRPLRFVELQLTEAVLQATRAGLGVTVMARWAVEPELARGDLAAISIGSEGLGRGWRVATRSDVGHRRAVRELTDLLIERLRDRR